MAENQPNTQGQNTKPQISNATVKKPSFLMEVLKYAFHEEIEPRSRELVRNAISGTFNMMNDAANKAVDKAFYPDGNAPRRITKSDSGTYQPKTNYSTRVYSSNKPKEPSINQRSSIDINYIWVDTEEEAKSIVATLIEEIENYNKAKVATLYEMVKQPTTFADFKFGWTKNEESQIGYRRDSGKWFIDLPKPVSIENV